MRKTTTTTHEENPSLDMSSLIDVSFLLLIYFIVTSTLDPKEADIGMTLPVEKRIPGEPLIIDTMQIDVNSSGAILVNEEILDADPASREVPFLLDRLRTYAESARLINSEPVVIVAADDAAKGQRFVDVLNALAHRDVAIDKVTISGFID
ncbi:MAG: biopolymer transporter ExbD [Verrucomicrobiales bacterium]|nr:biopolymer transporter ExbD [Verrucomicrobiales bacterium]